jgi:hypothetical protein
VKDCTTSDQQAHDGMTTLIEYLWNDEETDYLATMPRQRPEHIFTTLKKIQGWLLMKKKMLDNSFHTVARSAYRVLPTR